MIDLLICGGGVIGMSIAYEAIRRTNWTVAILDRGNLGAGASWSGAGILPPSARLEVHDPIDQLRFLADQLMDDWVASIQSESQIDVGYLRCGGVYVARSKAEFATLAAQAASWEMQGIEHHRVSDLQSIACDSMFSKSVLQPTSAWLDASVLAAWFLPGERQIRNPRYLKALRKVIEARGVSIMEQVEIDSIEHPDVRVDGSKAAFRVSTSLEPILANRICFTTGAWTRQLLQKFSKQQFVSDQSVTDVYPVRGQMILYQLGRQMWQPILNEGHRYLVPRADGYVLAGSCEEDVGFDLSTTEQAITALREWSCELVPQLKSASIEKVWSGLRPGSIDGLPYLTEISEVPGVYVAAGHYRHGIHFSPATAKVMVDLMLEEKIDLDMSPFQMRRGATYSKSGVETAAS